MDFKFLPTTAPVALVTIIIVHHRIQCRLTPTNIATMTTKVVNANYNYVTTKSVSDY